MQIRFTFDLSVDPATPPACELRRASPLITAQRYVAQTARLVH